VALRGGGGTAVPPAPAAVLPGVGAALALPPPVALAAPVLQAVAVWWVVCGRAGR
jgi:hypothetical protein